MYYKKKIYWIYGEGKIEFVDSSKNKYKEERFKEILNHIFFFYIKIEKQIEIN